MKLLHLATTYPLHAGDSNAAFVEAIAEGLAARGHEVHVLLPWHPELDLERADSEVRLHAFRYSPTAAWHPWGYAQALTADRSLRWDAWLAVPPAAVASVTAARRLLRRGGFDLYHAHWLLPNGPLAALALLGRSEPLVVSCHGSGVYMAEQHRWAAAAARWTGRRTAAVTACSRDLASRAERFVSGSVDWTPYGVDPVRFCPRPGERDELRSVIGERHGVPTGDPWILAVGRLVHKKGFDRLVEALPTVRQRVPGARVLLVGEGPLRGELLERARQAGVEEAVHLLGAAAHAEIPGYYAAADLVAVPSVHGPGGNVDGLPNTFMEGLASGTPVVASRVGGMPDIARDGETALLVPEGDPRALGRAVAALLGDEDRRRRMGAAARDDVEERLGWDGVARRLEEIYLRSLGRSGGPARAPHEDGGS